MPRSVDLIVDYSDGVRKQIKRIPWRVNSDRFRQYSRAARDRPHGVTFISRGTGETAFVTQIDDLKNEGGGDNAKNWVFRVNDHLFDKGRGVARGPIGRRHLVEVRSVRIEWGGVLSEPRT